MERWRRRGPSGTWRVLGRDAATCARVLEVAEEKARQCARAAEPVVLAGREAWLKGGPLRGSAAWRYGLRRRLLGMQPPRMRELVNLLWLRGHAFRAPAPLAAGSLEHGGRMRYQFLATERIDGAADLERWLPGAPAHERAPVLEELAREAGRMHALGFVHRDLFPRNLLVTAAAPDGRRLVLIDAWRGGAGVDLRGPAHDLACLMLAGASLLDADEQRRFFDAYARSRQGHGAPVELPALLRSAARRRARLHAQLTREPHRWRGSEAPAPRWDPAALL